MPEKTAGKAEEELQSKYYEFQLINEQIKQLQQQQEALDEQTSELKLTLEALTDLGKTREKETILVPIGQGIFAKAELKDSKNLIVNVGSNIMVGKDTEGAKKMLDERLQAVEIYKEQSSSGIMELARRAKKLEAELQGLLSDARGKDV